MTITAHEPEQLQRYAFGLRTAEAVVCRRCGVYVAMVLTEGERAWSTINIDAIDGRALLARPAEPRDFSAEDVSSTAPQGSLDPDDPGELARAAKRFMS